MRTPHLLACALVALLVSLAPSAATQHWSNYGGGPGRNGRSPWPGPQSAELLWSNTDDPAVISWHPFTEDGRVFTVREAGFPQDGGAANDAIVAYDVHTGAELWRTTLPFGGDTSTEWIAWVGGVRDGRLYASRSSNLQPAPLHCLDAATGAVLWTSAWTSEAWAHDGVVFAPDGDPVVGDRLRVARLDAADGSVIWETARACPVSGNCGVAASADAVFMDEPSPGFANKIVKLDMATGARLYESAALPGATDQNSPFVSADGATVFFARTQNNPAVDFLYAFDDTGSALVERWSVPVRWTTSHEHGLAADGDVYTFLPTDELVRLDAADGSVVASAGVLAPIVGNLSPKTVVGANGNVYVSNGWASSPAGNGRVWAFEADLGSALFTLSLVRPNAGGPALGRDGTLVVCDLTGVYAYRTPTPWSDLGGALAGAAGEPFLLGEGEQTPGSPARVTLSGGPPGAPSTVVVGASAITAPFKGGVLVPAPDLLVGPTALDAAGALQIDFTWPDVPSGFPLWWQVWQPDTGGVLGWSSSNALGSITP